MSDEPIVQVRDLVKVYPGGTRAVAGIDFDVPRGDFFGFLGPNGAGKTTTMRILGTLLRKTSGTVTVGGFDVDVDSKAIRRSIGFAMQEVGLDDLATGRDFLRLQGVLYGLSRGEAHRKADELLEVVALTHFAGQRVGTYSGGMRRRIDLAGALMHDPDIVFLDEPSVGLDPQSRLAMWEHLEESECQGSHHPAHHPGDGRGRPALPQHLDLRSGTNRRQRFPGVPQDRGGWGCGADHPGRPRRGFVPVGLKRWSASRITAMGSAESTEGSPSPSGTAALPSRASSVCFTMQGFPS